jgi:hypothetical protein
VPLDLGTEVMTGLYWLRLTQSGHSLLSRVVLIQ